MNWGQKLAIAGSLLGAGYSKPAQKQLAKVLLGDRVPAIDIVEQLLKANPRLAALLGSGNAGRIGSGLARDYAILPELGQ